MILLLVLKVFQSYYSLIFNLVNSIMICITSSFQSYYSLIFNVLTFHQNFLHHHFNPIIVLFLTFLDHDYNYDKVIFQSYYSLIFNHEYVLCAEDDFEIFQSYYSLIFNPYSFLYLLFIS